MSQTTYNTDLTNAFAGMLADLSPRNDMLSRHWENATSAPYGIGVADGTDPDRQVDHAPDAAGKLRGVLVHSHDNEVGADDQNLVDENRAVSVLNAGRIYVEVEEAVTPASVPHLRVAAGAGGTQLGAWRASVDAASARATTGTRFLSSAGAGELAILEIDADAAVS